MRNLLYISTLVVLGACGMSQDKFADKYVETYCEAWGTCNSATDCPIASGGEVSDSCDYDKKAAKACIKGDYTCDDSLGEGMEFVVPPSDCAKVCGAGDETDETAEE